MICAQAGVTDRPELERVVALANVEQVGTVQSLSGASRVSERPCSTIQTLVPATPPDFVADLKVEVSVVQAVMGFEAVSYGQMTFC